MLADAREAGTELTLDDLVRVAGRTPVLASLVPTGEYTAEEFQRAGGTAVVIRELVRGGLLDGSAPTVAGATLAEAIRNAPAPDGEVLIGSDGRAAGGSGLAGGSARGAARRGARRRHDHDRRRRRGRRARAR